MAYKKRHKMFTAGRRAHARGKDILNDNPGLTDFDRWQWQKGWRIASFFKAIRDEEKESLKEFLEYERKINELRKPEKEKSSMPIGYMFPDAFPSKEK